MSAVSASPIPGVEEIDAVRAMQRTLYRPRLTPGDDSMPCSFGFRPKRAADDALVVGGEGFDFLGFHHRLVRARGRSGARRVIFLARWPSRQAMQHARDRVREITDRKRLLVPQEQVIREVNAFVRRWAGYFRYGNSANAFDKLSHHIIDRVGHSIAKKHRHGRRYGWHLFRASPSRLGLYNLDGIVVAPIPNRPWRAPVERRR